jgi:RND family efflux transporter MFP subunit
MNNRLPIAAALLVLTACSSKQVQPKGQQGTGPAVKIRVITLSNADIPQILSVSGTVAAKTTAGLASQIMARVVSVKAHEGDHVAAGQTLIILDSDEADARYAGATAAREESRHSIDAANLEISAAKANLDLAQVTHGRLTDLYDKRSISNQEFDESTARLKAAQSAYHAAQARLEEMNSRSEQVAATARLAQISKGYSHIVAPFSGVVVTRNAEPGMTAVPGSPLLTVEREGNHRLEAAVADSHLANIRLGQKVPVQIDALSQQVNATVSEIMPVADPQSRSATVKLDLPALKSLHSGMFGTALFSEGNQTALVVPTDSIIEHGQLSSVLVVEEGFARSRLVTTGKKFASGQVVLSGLSQGEHLIYPIPANVVDGTAVEVQK